MLKGEVNQYGDFGFEGDVDHINPEKFVFRREAIAFDRRRAKIVEFGAGVGYLTSRIYAPACREVVVVEKDPTVFSRLLKRTSRFLSIRYYNKTSREFINNDLSDHPDFSAVDFDFFGSPGEDVITFFAAIEGRLTRPFLLLMTDDGLLAARRHAPINLYQYYLTGHNVISKFPVGLADRFEEFQACFIERLVARHGFASESVGAKRNHNETVLYSAYVITKS